MSLQHKIKGTRESVSMSQNEEDIIRFASVNELSVNSGNVSTIFQNRCYGQTQLSPAERK